MLNVIFLGPPGSGKGTQASIIAKKFNLEVCAIGDILRAEQESGSDLGLQIKELISKGELASLDIIIRIIKSKINSSDKGFLFDGIPRNLDQVEALENALNDVGKSIDKVIEFQINDEKILNRLKKRYICANCSSTIAIDSDVVCTVCGSVNVSQREDDLSDKAIQRRLEIFNVESKKIIAFYKEKNILCSIDADQDVQKVTNGIVKCLNPKDI